MTRHLGGGDLRAEADSFADELGRTLAAVVPVEEPTAVEVEVAEPETPARVAISTAPIPLLVDDDPALTLELEFLCEWDHQQRYLAVRASEFVVAAIDTDTPLFRYDFVDDARVVPSAHLQIHAHRDEIVFHMVRGQRHRAKRRSKHVDGRPRGKYPRLSNLHFPLGGRRMRPCVEDVLQFAIEEFAIQTVDGWQDALSAGRARWRRKQVAAVVRDTPITAAAALEALGYSVTPPARGHPRERAECLAER